MRVVSAVLLLGLVAPALTTPDCRPGCNRPSGANFTAFLDLLQPSNQFFQRAAFHDCGDGSIFDGTGGADGSLQFETGRTVNAGLAPTVNFLASTAHSMGVSVADTIVLAATLSVVRCGGPNIKFFPGRIDAKSAGPDGRIPVPTDSEGFLQSDLGRRMSMTFAEQTSFITGSHTIGCVHGADQPQLTKKSCAPFDTTSTVFDNQIFKELVAGTSKDLLGTDQRMLSDPVYQSSIQQWAASQSAFFGEYTTAFGKLDHDADRQHAGAEAQRGSLGGAPIGAFDVRRGLGALRHPEPRGNALQRRARLHREMLPQDRNLGQGG
ncbi:heme peroxidase [Blyttiomyces helicus]|uniref:Peroxidase n=1 Tax=Blyttiomyces helicus TaxID=388810 RepID=A0A4P9VW22_9FUNG|nr:heme peroxidase [Blyttiomyces helicus]|eukprot:RKO83884.1 heme peroxidase [Blyttiomyces helicus]